MDVVDLVVLSYVVDLVKIARMVHIDSRDMFASRS